MKCHFVPLFLYIMNVSFPRCPSFPSCYRGVAEAARTTSTSQMILSIQLCQHLLSDMVDSLVDQACLSRTKLAGNGPDKNFQNKLNGPGKSVWDWLISSFRYNESISDIQAVLDK